VPETLVVSETEQIVHQDVSVELVEVPSTEVLVEQGDGEVLETQAEPQLLHATTTEQEVLERGTQEVLHSLAEGPQGPPGQDGADGAGDAHYVHDQGVAAATWTIEHSLYTRPAVYAEETSTGSVLEGAVTYDSLNQLTITFSAAVSGRAFLN
jgi:hypothetical protein